MAQNLKRFGIYIIFVWFFGIDNYKFFKQILRFLRMVTDLQFYRAVRSYSYRSNLIESIGELEQKIIDYMNDKNLTKASLPGYLVLVSYDRIFD